MSAVIPIPFPLEVARFRVPGVPAPAGSKKAFPRQGGGFVIADASKRSKPWQAQVAAAAAEAMAGRPPTPDVVSLELVFTMPRPRKHYGTGARADALRADAPVFHATRPDTTKLIRAVEDAMTGIVWRDDGQVALQSAFKMYGESAGVTVRVASR